ncbi:MAG: FkbM family methyltransferase [Sedimentisphaerales bacterium]|nr:FkbM family methyltransferase [Sedimentisphaerales bacterium]
MGNWSLQCIKQFQRSVRLYAFEPSKHTFDQLAENLSAANGHLMGKVVFPFNIGLSDVAQTKMLYYDRELSGLASVYKRNLAHFTKSMDCQEQVSLVTLDDFCRQQRIERINFLKLDTEGHELNILKGAQKLIEASAIDFIQFEFGGCNIDYKTYFQDFFYCLAPKYKIYRVCRDGLRYITSYKEQYEIFITVNYLAEIREPSVPEQAVLD